jgi:hypothetical protein
MEESTSVTPIGTLNKIASFETKSFLYSPLDLEIIWNYKGDQVTVVTLDGRCLYFSHENNQLISNQDKSHDLLRKIAKKNMYKLERMEYGDLRLLDKKVWGAVISENDITYFP